MEIVIAASGFEDPEPTIVEAGISFCFKSPILRVAFHAQNCRNVDVFIHVQRYGYKVAVVETPWRRGV